MNLFSAQISNPAREEDSDSSELPYVKKVFESKQIEEKEKTILLKETNNPLASLAVICSFCNNAYSSPHQFEVHYNSHKSDSKPYECWYCSKKFNQKSNLKTHLRIHTGERPFYCTDKHCNMTFKTQGQLQDHFNSHYNVRPYKCDICSKAFNRKSRVKRHKMIHFNMKPFKCEYVNCDKAFRQRGTLKTHYKTHLKRSDNVNTVSIEPINLIVSNEQGNLTEDDSETIISLDL